MNFDYLYLQGLNYCHTEKHISAGRQSEDMRMGAIATKRRSRCRHR